MNYLAHAYLSFGNSNVLVGNMISDYIKGKKQYDYPAEIQAGIQLHRAIDAFTDTHEATQNVKTFFKKDYRLYAGAFADVVYDYFLANDKNEFETEAELKNFSTTTYSLMAKQQEHFPEKFLKMFPYMQEQDWLYNYRTNEGMQKSFGGLARRAKYITETDTAYKIFLENKTAIQKEYDVFFPAVKAFALDKMKMLLTN
jgi:acyl carrier protein phosphodiesterase